MLRAELVGEDTVLFADRFIRHRTPILTLCRHLVDADMETTASLTVYREGKPAVLVRAIGKAAGRTVEEEPNTRFSPFRPGPAFRGVR